MSKREWENWIVGDGYQAKGVIRQKAEARTTKVIDMTRSKLEQNQPTNKPFNLELQIDEERKRQLEKSDKQEKKLQHTNDGPFNPLLQLLCSRMSQQ